MIFHVVQLQMLYQLLPLRYYHYSEIYGVEYEETI